MFCDWIQFGSVVMASSIWSYCSATSGVDGRRGILSYLEYDVSWSVSVFMIGRCLKLTVREAPVNMSVDFSDAKNSVLVSALGQNLGCVKVFITWLTRVKSSCCPMRDAIKQLISSLYFSWLKAQISGFPFSLLSWVFVAGLLSELVCGGILSPTVSYFAHWIESLHASFKICNPWCIWMNSWKVFSGLWNDSFFKRWFYYCLNKMKTTIGDDLQNFWLAITHCCLSWR